jgi:hypothetical protein
MTNVIFVLLRIAFLLLREPLIKSVFLHTAKAKGSRTGFAAKKRFGFGCFTGKSGKRHRCCGVSRPLLPHSGHLGGLPLSGMGREELAA